MCCYGEEEKMPPTNIILGSVQNIYFHERRRLIFTFVTFSWQQILDEFELAYFIWEMNLETILVVRISIRARCTTLCDTVCQRLATGRWFSPGPPVSSTNKTDRNDMVIDSNSNQQNKKGQWVQEQHLHVYWKILMLLNPVSYSRQICCCSCR
jgi:hypothetical protein